MAAISTSEERDEGGDLLLWVLVWGELAAFGILLTGYVVMSMLHPESFELAKLHLAPRLAGFNTVVLLASSWQAALAASSHGKPRRQRLFLLGTALLGLLFVILKFAEYSTEWAATGDANLQVFFELYFLITGFHLAHVAFVGLLFLWAAIRPERSTIVTLTTVWHVIDIVWLVMFPLIYLS
ncbi:cytochrome c oxidase subunit 3 [Rhizobium terrae]|uniref:cytochrome c oxidase subunit 3 n=1 Tax=Rhizobium terrae TaxID=2171756 RepID=UPI000E3DFDA5|nr:cytochrome c oxidase subunit 3 [Rhizobium terrae]